MVLSCFDAVSECLIGNFFFDTRSTKTRDKARLIFETQIKITEMPNLCRSNDKPLSYNCRPTIQCTRQGRPLEQT